MGETNCADITLFNLFKVFFKSFLLSVSTSQRVYFSKCLLLKVSKSGCLSKIILLKISIIPKVFLFIVRASQNVFYSKLPQMSQNNKYSYIVTSSQMFCFSNVKLFLCAFFLQLLSPYQV